MFLKIVASECSGRHKVNIWLRGLVRGGDGRCSPHAYTTVSSCGESACVELRLSLTLHSLRPQNSTGILSLYFVLLHVARRLDRASYIHNLHRF